eukprot:2704273-Pleurochrysis_carterae.AAC.1
MCERALHRFGRHSRGAGAGGLGVVARPKRITARGKERTRVAAIRSAFWHREAYEMSCPYARHACWECGRARGARPRAAWIDRRAIYRQLRVERARAGLRTRRAKKGVSMGARAVQRPCVRACRRPRCAVIAGLLTRMGGVSAVEAAVCVAALVRGDAADGRRQRVALALAVIGAVSLVDRRLRVKRRVLGIRRRRLRHAAATALLL